MPSVPCPSRDKRYRFKEPRLWRFVPGTRWGVQHSKTTPDIHPGHRVWPTVREALEEAQPYFVHFKVHDFSLDAFTVAEAVSRRSRYSWIAFNSSRFATGLAPHRTHGKLSVDRNRSALEHVLSYYELSGRKPEPLSAEVRRRCRGLVPRCSVPWAKSARFRS